MAHDTYEHERRQTAALERIVQLLELGLKPRSGTPSWSPRIAYPHETPLPCYENDLNRCACPTCINEPKIPGKRPLTEAQRCDRFLTPNVHPPNYYATQTDHEHVWEDRHGVEVCQICRGLRR